MLSLTFSIGTQWAGFQSLLGQFWPWGLMFDTPALNIYASTNACQLFPPWLPIKGNPFFSFLKGGVSVLFPAHFQNKMNECASVYLLELRSEKLGTNCNGRQTTSFLIHMLRCLNPSLTAPIKGKHKLSCGLIKNFFLETMKRAKRESLGFGIKLKNQHP